MLEEIITIAHEKKASDIHLSENHFPVLRINNNLETIEDVRFVYKAEDRNKIIDSVCPGSKGEDLRLHGSQDISLVTNISDGTETIHSRCNIFLYNGGQLGFSIRLLSNRIPSPKELLIPGSIIDLIHQQHGLIIVSGPTGSGKSTTIASLLNLINETRSAHIVTLEDPIEYIIREKDSIIHQREIKTDCSDFATGLRAALREDPDVILVGEMRDADTISTALAAAETGHLVFTTLHSANVIEAIDRLLQYFPPEQYSQIRGEIAQCFKGIIAQKLFKSTKGGRVAAFEVIYPSDAIKNLIRQGSHHRIYDYIHPTDGMQSMEQAIKGLSTKHLI